MQSQFAFVPLVFKSPMVRQNLMNEVQHVGGAFAVVGSRVVIVLSVLLKRDKSLIIEKKSFIAGVACLSTHVLALVAINGCWLVADLNEMIQLVQQLFTRRVNFRVGMTHRFVERLMRSYRRLEILSI